MYRGRVVALCHGLVPHRGHGSHLDGYGACRGSVHGDGRTQVVGGVDGERGQASCLDDVEALAHRYAVLGIRGLRRGGVGIHVQWPYRCAGSRDAQSPDADNGCAAGEGIARYDGCLWFGERTLDGRDVRCRGHLWHEVLAPVVGLVVHHAVPLASRYARVVFRRHRHYLVEGFLCLTGIFHGKLFLSYVCVYHALACPEQLDVLVGAGQYGIFQQLVVGVAQGGGYAAPKGYGTVVYPLVLLYALVYLLVGEVEVAQLHMLRLGGYAETVVLHLDVVDFVGEVLPEGPCRPFPGVFVCLVGLPAVDVPSQVHAELQFLLCRLDVAHVDYPLVAHALVVRLAQLVAAKGGRDGAEP